MEEENKVLETQPSDTQENKPNPEEAAKEEVVETSQVEAAPEAVPAEAAPVEEKKEAVKEEKVESKPEEKKEAANEKKEAKKEEKGKPSKEEKAAEGKENKEGEETTRGGKKPPRAFKPRKEEKEFIERVVKINRISKTVKGGKRMRFSALVVIGDSKGRYGFGMGKSIETPEAIKKAIACAKKQLNKVEIVEGDTIAHEIVGKFGATMVYLKPAPEGTGLVAGGAVRAILELAGIKNVYSKIYGSRTQMNVVKATVNGLTGLKSYAKVKQIRYNK